MKLLNHRITESISHPTAIHRLILDQDQHPIDFEFIEVNKTYEELFGLFSLEIIGKTGKSIYNESSEFLDLLNRYGEVVLGGSHPSFQWTSNSQSRTFRVDIFSHEPLTFETRYTDITQEVLTSKIKDIVLNSINDVVLELDEDLTFVNVYTNDEKHLFVPSSEVLNRSIHSLFSKEFLMEILPIFEKAKESNERQSFIYPSILEGDSRWFRAVIVYTSINEIHRYVLSINEFTDHKHSAESLSETSMRLTQLAEYTRTFIWECDQDGLYTYLSDNVLQVLGHRSDELVGKLHFYDLHPLMHRQKFKKRTQEIFGNRETVLDFPNELLKKDGSLITVSTNSFPIIDKNGNITGYRGSDIDISERISIDEAVRINERKFRLITENTSDVIWVLSLKTMQTTYVSPSVFKQSGFTPDEVKHQKMSDIISASDLDDYLLKINKGLQQFKANPQEDLTLVLEAQQYCKDGSLIWVESSISFNTDEMGEVEIIGVTRNIDKRKQAEKEIIYLSYHDQLTGVYNRSFYEEEITRLNTKRNLPFTLVVCDINGLKLTNDAFGHMAGDRLINSMAQVLKKICRQDDIIARIGGDEFAILLPKTNEQVASLIVSRIHEEIALTKPEKIKLSASFGLKTKLTLEEGFSELFKQAEDQMYLEKVKHQTNVKMGMIRLITTSLFEKYPDEKQHANNVSALCRQFGEALHLRNAEINDLEMAGLLHDIGKIGLDEGLITEDKYSTFDETPEYKRHSEMGYQIIRSVYTYAHIAEYILSHHEWFNGLGYPRGLKGVEIPLQARIIKIASDFSSQIDREGLDVPQTLDFIKVRSGSQYDPQLVEVLTTMFTCNPTYL